MAWTQITGIPTQYQKSDGTLASGYYLKFYADGTSTAINMATDSTGGTTLDKCQLNSSGYPINGSSAVFIPHIDQAYKIVLYKNSTDADNDTTGNADWVIDNLTQVLSDASSTTYNPGGTGPASTDVQTRLRYQVWVADKGAQGDNSTDDYQDITDAIADVNAAGGGVVHFENGKTYKVNTALIILPGVHLELNGSTIRQTLTGDGGYNYGLRMRSNTGIRNGTVSTESSGTVGSQVGIHSAIMVGPLYGDGGTVASPSADNNIENFVIENMTLKTDADGKAAIQISGNSHNGIIRNIVLPDSPDMTGIHLDWGILGNIETADSQISATRTRFDAGTALSTHPNNILIENIYIGELTLPVGGGGGTLNAHGVRISACHNITVRNVFVNKSAYAGFFHTAGDVGYEFATPDNKRVAHQGIKVVNFQVEDAQTGWGFYINGYADNIDRANTTYGYTFLLDPRVRCDIELDQCTTSSESGSSALPGVRIENIKGGTIRRTHPKNHSKGILVEENAELVRVVECDPEDNREEGIYVGHSSDFPFRCEVRNCRPRRNGSDAGYGNAAGIYFNGATECTAAFNQVGDETSETTQEYGIQVSNTCTDMNIIYNHVEDAVSIAYVMGDSEGYTNIQSFNNNTYNSGNISTYWSGPNIVPLSKTLNSSGEKIGIYRGQRAALVSSDTTPPSGDWIAGDIILFDDGASNTRAYGVRCDTSGTGGAGGTSVWKELGTLVSTGNTGGTGSAGATNTYVELTTNDGVTHKVLTRP